MSEIERKDNVDAKDPSFEHPNSAEQNSKEPDKQEFLIAPKLRIGEDKYIKTDAAGVRRVIKSQNGYEVLVGAVIPYYDFDREINKETKCAWFKSESEMKSAWQPTLQRWHADLKVM